jgi:hypothetical protein
LSAALADVQKTALANQFQVDMAILMPVWPGTGRRLKNAAAGESFLACGLVLD